MSDIEKYSDATFESIKHTNADGQEYWLARELQAVLEYTQWRRFSEVIERAKESCKNSGYSVEDHFAVKTRQQELIENYDILSEEQKRLAIRAEMVEHNKSLAEAAKQAGVETPQEYAVFQNKGYQGLYGGLGMRDIHARKGLKPNEKILDHMGSTELAANLFRATQTDEKLRRENIQGKDAANETHYQVGRKVRQTIAELGGTMPEDLPAPEKSIKQIQREQKKLAKGKDGQR